jgi:hypothetical protein
VRAVSVPSDSSRPELGVLDLGGFALVDRTTNGYQRDMLEAVNGAAPGRGIQTDCRPRVGGKPVASRRQLTRRHFSDPRVLYEVLSLYRLTVILETLFSDVRLVEVPQTYLDGQRTPLVLISMMLALPKVSVLATPPVPRATLALTWSVLPP